ncbi:hypothetical protein [Arthrobacter sp. NicSoilC5]|uniref:hypothetical protein n=1 Tax=Arthrobacter sp. NicSoilC5 TaxID=2831000 RepID=UPI001CC5162F|nr:hypothetical protein [Arthrobacter sp. NicSoilC5]BCW79014.1 hypothetical protein NicSoilC5_10330 [Arthrobacter sp. NicSoilC5]
MTVNRGPGVAKNGSVGVTTLEHRLQLAGQYAENAPGVPRSGVLAQATAVLVSARADMSYDIGPFQAVISRTASEGVYTPTLTGTTNVPTADAPATNSRWDLVYVKQNDIAKGDADNLAVVGVVNGTAAASPTKPTGSLPAGAMVLAEARIFAGTTATNGGSNTVSQVWRHTAARGGDIPVRNTTERAEITTPAPGQGVLRLDIGSLEIWNGAKWLTTVSSGIPYTPIWTGVADFGSGGSLTGTYWVHGDLVTLKARATFGAAGTMGTNAVYCPLPPGLPISGGQAYHLGTGVHVVGSNGFARRLVVMAGSPTTAAVWAPVEEAPAGRIQTPGAAGYPSGSGDYMEITITYQTSGS